MPSRRSVIIAFAIAALATPSLAAEQSARDFLAAIYANYQGKDSKGQPFDTTAKLNALFTPELARIIDTDAKAAARRKEVGALGGDPFIDAQDWEIAGLAIDVKDSGPTKATGVVTFKNLGKDTTITLVLVKLKQGWRIDEIRMPSGSLRALFKKK